jgi:hypothetical protein
MICLNAGWFSSQVFMEDVTQQYSGNVDNCRCLTFLTKAACPLPTPCHIMSLQLVITHLTQSPAVPPGHS